MSTLVSTLVPEMNGSGADLSTPPDSTIAIAPPPRTETKLTFDDSGADGPAAAGSMVMTFLVPAAASPAGVQ